MGSSDHSDDEETRSESMSEEMADSGLPQRIFSPEEVPKGDRVNIYQKMTVISDIDAALSQTERDFMKASQFGKLFDFANQPAWSGAFGKPNRFSIREFKIVSGLKCGKYPTSQKKKRRPHVVPEYFKTLFGDEKEVPVERPIEILQKKTSLETRLRLRYACLAIVDAFLMPSVHFSRSKVSMDHAEMVEDLDAFLQYPWGRLSFDVMMNSIKGRNLAQILTANITVGGLFPALQMVVLEAVPAIQEDDDSSDGEDSSPSRGGAHLRPQKVQLQLNKARVLDKDEMVRIAVNSIIRPDFEISDDEEDLSWSEDEQDERVDHMITLINQGFEFKSEMFGPGIDPEVLAARTSSRRGVKKTKIVVGKKGKGKMRKSGRSRVTNVAHDSDKGVMFSEEKLKTMVSKIVQENNKKIERMFEANNVKIIKGVTQWFLDNAVIDREVNICPSFSGLSAGKSRSRKQPPPSTANKSGELPSVQPGAHHDGQAKQNCDTPFPNLDFSSMPTVDEIVSTYAPRADDATNTARVGKGTVDPIGECSVDAVDGEQVMTHNPGDDGVVLSETRPEKENDGASLPQFNPQNDVPKSSDGVNLQVEENPEHDDPLKSGPNYVLIPPVGENFIDEVDGVGDVQPDEIVTSDIPEPNAVISVDEDIIDPKNLTIDSEEQAKVEHVQRRVSKRQKTVSTRLDSPFPCEKRIRTIIENSEAVDDSEKALQQRFDKAMKASGMWGRKPSYIEEPKRNAGETETNACKGYGFSMFFGEAYTPRRQSAAESGYFGKFVSMLSKLHPKFSRTDPRADFKFSKAVTERLKGVGEVDRLPLFSDADILYLPFNLDIKHWVFLAVHLSTCKIEVLDCKTNLRTDASMTTEIRPIAEMLPYLFIEVADNEKMSQLSTTKYDIERITDVP
ncbi:uncharacterized protein LOC112083922 [Eutrema salsugineum]|uniref:uncharacterized protein LOC112083922 n=1 Tax=Eutrema salsugineum TaxID=72664 RepID=UPI000CED14F3|nr:uncharacterized protein LOC112083922 [Eutrema salsugineum]